MKRKKTQRAGFTLIELAIAACLLVILLGLAVSLSRQVRSESARALTHDLLARLERLADLHRTFHNGQMPEIEPPLPEELSPLVASGDGITPPRTDFPAESAPTSKEAVDELERMTRRLATRNNREILLALGAGLRPLDSASDQFRDLPLGVYDPQSPSLRDAWGTPIIFLPRQHPLLGRAPRNAPFFVSAGPDRKFTTRGDNLNSYEAFSR